MAPKPGMLAFVFGMVLAMGMTILSITTWAAPPDSEREWAAPPPPKETIYRPENWTVY
jgi:hypothetical protein